MTPEDKGIINNAIKNSFELRGEVLNFGANGNFQLALTQLDFFKVIASLNIGLIGIGYLYNNLLDKTFLLTSLFFAVMTLIICISYTRESIDEHSRILKEIEKDVFKATDESLKAATESIQSDKPNIFWDHIFKKLEEKNEKTKQELNYIGELVVLFFYLSLGLLLFSYLSVKYQFSIFSYQTAILLILIWLLSFKEWAINFAKLMSKYISIRARKK